MRTAEAPVEVVQQAPVEPLRHFFCSCQRDNPGGHRYALCGAELSGKGAPFPSKRVDLCVLCQDIKATGAQCAYCGNWIRS